MHCAIFWRWITREFLWFFHIHKMRLLTLLGPFPGRFYILQFVKSLPFHILQAQKMYLFGRTLAWIYSANRLPVAGALLNKKKLHGSRIWKQTPVLMHIYLILYHHRLNESIAWSLIAVGFFAPKPLKITLCTKIFICCINS